MIYFTADYHLGHGRIIEYCNRPFKSVEEMDETIIENHNKTVGKTDTVFFLGDLCFSRIDKYWPRLNGNMIFIEGNHDRRIQLPYRIKSIDLKINGKRVLLSHKENVMATLFCSDGIIPDLYLVGHSHDVWKFKYKTVNVGCDQWNFKPVKFDYLLKMYNKWARGKSNVENNS